MARPSYTQSGPAQWDCAIDGQPFLYAPTGNRPIVRQGTDALKEQFDSTGVPGENALSNWWYRSQNSFHHGGGIKYFDGEADLAYRYKESWSVDVWTPGQVTSLYKPINPGAAADGSHHPFTYLYGTMFIKGTKMGALQTDGTMSWPGVFDQLAVTMTASPEKWFVCTQRGIWAGPIGSPPQPGGSIYSLPNGVTGYVAALGWVKSRLIACVNQYVWNLAGTTSGVLTTAATHTTELDPFYKHPLASWEWTAVADGPEAIYLSGFAGSHSEVMAVNLDPQTGALEKPRQVASMPDGEKILSMISYLGTYIILGTTEGVRICEIQSGGALSVGPLTWESEDPVRSIVANGKFLYCCGGYVEGEGHCLVRINLGEPLVSNGRYTGHFAWARDLGYASGTPEGVAMLGTTGRPVATGPSVLYASATERLPGWIQTGRIRFGTWEDKNFAFIRMLNKKDGATAFIGANWVDEENVIRSLGTWNTTTATDVKAEGADGEPHEYVSYRFVIDRAEFRGYQVKAAPSGVKERIIQVPLLCFEREQPAGGPSIIRPVYPRVKALETAEAKNSLVNWQDFTTGETALAVIDKVEFVSTLAPSTRPERSQRGGILTVTLRLVG